MTKVVRAPYQAASQELIAKLITAGYFQPALRNDADAITTAITRLKEDLRGGKDDKGVRVNFPMAVEGSGHNQPSLIAGPDP
jgi:hypothetical protein